MADLQRALDVLQLDTCRPITPELIRKQYLRLALKLHPDRNPAGDAAEAFRALGDAYALALGALAHGEAARVEAERTQALVALFLRALRGEDVRGELEQLGVYRPSEQFGVDLGVRFDSRLDDGEGDEQEEGDVQPDLAVAFQQAFQNDGMTPEGDPVEGFAMGPDEEMM